MEKRYIKDRLRRSMMFVPGNNPGMIADARIYTFEDLLPDYDQLENLARNCKTEAAVKKAKEIVPEFISNNSSFSKLDHKTVAA